MSGSKFVLSQWLPTCCRRPRRWNGSFISRARRLHVASQQVFALTANVWSFLLSSIITSLFFMNTVLIHLQQLLCSYCKHWRSWVRHCATSRKEAASIFSGDFDIFHLLNPSVLGIELASKRHEYQVYLLGCKGCRYIGMTTLPPSCADCIEILGVLSSWIPKGLSRALMG